MAKIFHSQPLFVFFGFDDLWSIFGYFEERFVLRKVFLASKRRGPRPWLLPVRRHPRTPHLATSVKGNLKNPVKRLSNQKRKNQQPSNPHKTFLELGPIILETSANYQETSSGR